MFQPARMTRLVLGGHRSRMEGTIEALQQEGLLHLEDFQDPTGTTHIGTPLEAGDAASALLVRVRGILKGLDADRVAPAPGAVRAPEQVLADAEKDVLPVLEAAAAERTRLGQAESEAALLRLFEPLDVELGSLDGLRSVRGYVGTSRADPAAALAAAGVPAEVQAVPQAGRTLVAVFVPRAQAEKAERVLAESGFSAANLPKSAGTPRSRLAELRDEAQQRHDRLTELEQQAVRLRDAWGPRLAAVERHLADVVDRTQAPLRFAVTQTTFHAEGWVPVREAARVRKAIAARFGDAVYVEELGDAPRTGDRPGGGHGMLGGHEPHAKHAGPGAGHPAHAGHGDDHADDHGDDHHDADPRDEAPVHLENPGPARPFEFLLGLLGRPRYKEIDPTKLMLVFFPLFFGLMVGDLLIGLVIMGVGLWLKSNHVFGIGGPAVGRVLVMGGLMAALVGGVVFGEALGIHFVVDQHTIDEGEPSWECILGLDVPTEGFLHVERDHPIDCTPAPHEDTAGEGAAHDGPTAADDHGDANGTANGTADGAGDGAGANGTLADTHGGGFAPQQAEAHEEEAHEEPLVSLAPHSEEHLSVNGWFNLGYYSKIHDIKALLLWSVIIGLAHLVLGFLIGIRNVRVAHGMTLAIQEKASWLILLAAAPVAIWGLTSGTTWALALGAGVFVVALGLLWVGTAKVLGVGFVAILEVLGFVGNVLSYTRIAAIGASKAGMAVAFMALGFDVLGGGSYHSVIGWVLYLFGMVVITLLAILSGGLQSLRLQFVEFFQKFYTGGGRPYLPFSRRAP